MSFFDPKHPLYQKAVVFTGELSIDRREAMQRAVNVGAVIKTAVSRKPIFLWWDGNTTDQEEPPPSATREEKAKAILAEGKSNLCLLTEAEFFVFYRALCTILCLQNPAPPQQNPDKKRRGPLYRCPRRTF